MNAARGLSLFPRTLTGRIMLVTALGVLLVQGINTIIRYQAFQARAVVEAASHLAATVANQLESLDPERDRMDWRKRRVSFVVSDTQIQPAGFKSTNELAERVAAPLQSIYPQVKSVRLSIGSVEQLPSSLKQGRRSSDAFDRRWPRRDESSEILLLTLNMDDGRWVHAAFAVRPHNFRPFALTLVETLLIYLGVLIPLLLVIRQISKPLRQLNQRLAHDGLASGAPPLVPQGPDDIRNLIDSFNGAEQRVNAMLIEKDVMLGAIGHDLKTPLASLRVRIESVEDDSERTKMAATIEEMVQILDDILILARLGKSAEALVQTDVGALVETVADELDADGRLTLADSDDKCRALIRPVLLRRALRNLIGNALQYGSGGEVATRCDGAMVTITVNDQGPGLDPAQLTSMFEPFARTESSRNRTSGGSGLGLTIARAIARAHGGDVVLENRAEGGLRAILTISQKAV
jgi:signal transduction histidine kinase